LIQSCIQNMARNLHRITEHPSPPPTPSPSPHYIINTGDSTLHIHNIHTRETSSSYAGEVNKIQIGRKWV
jgi:hypothetical protein